jgi:hypothetical protein
MVAQLTGQAKGSCPAEHDAGCAVGTLLSIARSNVRANYFSSGRWIRAAGHRQYLASAARHKLKAIYIIACNGKYGLSSRRLRNLKKR